MYKLALTRWQRAAGVLAFGAMLLLPVSGRAQQVGGSAPEHPLSLLLFPAEMATAEGEAAPAAGAAAPAVSAQTKMVQDIATSALRRSLGKVGISVVVYDKRLPSIQRAVSEGTLRETDVASPGDDPRKAQRLAEIVGAREYITAIVENYKFDAATRTATLNLSLIRSTIEEGATLGTAAAPGTFVAPADVAPSRQEGSAASRAAENAADQAVQGLFPRAAAAAALKNQPKKQAAPKPVRRAAPKPAPAPTSKKPDVPTSNALFGRDAFAR